MDVGSSRQVYGLRTGGPGQRLVGESVWDVDGIGPVYEGPGDVGSEMDEVTLVAVKTPIAAMVRRVIKKNARGGAGLQFVINVYIRIAMTPEDTKIMVNVLFMVEFGKRYFILNGL
ncbi:hypothetical protein Tco_0935542 [Tanacetum coccineum]